MGHHGISSLFGSNLAVFVLASAVLAITPGTAVIYLVTRTLGQGRSAGLASIGGIALGNFGNAVIASLGLAVIFAVSARAFTIVKLAGAAYLILLGVRALRRAQLSARAVQAGRAPHMSAFRDGFLVALLNPKTALFFAAFLPQFVDPGAAPLPQSILLGSIFVLIAAGTDTLYVLAAGALGPKIVCLGGRHSWGRYVTAISFI